MSFGTGKGFRSCGPDPSFKNNRLYQFIPTERFQNLILEPAHMDLRQYLRFKKAKREPLDDALIVVCRLLEKYLF